jgi:hypothetical protein
MQTQFQSVALSALRPPAANLLDSVSAISAARLSGVDMVDDLKTRMDEIQAEWMEKVRLATSPFPPSSILPQSTTDWLGYPEFLRRKKRKD